MAFNPPNIATLLSSEIFKLKVKASLLNQINQSVGIPTDNNSTLNKNILHLYANGFEAQQLVNRVVSALVSQSSLDSRSDDTQIDTEVGNVWNNLFNISL
jgi:hypothetical protein